MTPRHHLDPATVVSHAAGALSPELSAIVATHLEGCAVCRTAVARAERVGGMLVEQQQARPPDAALRDAILQKIASAPPLPPPAPATPAANDPDRIPAPLQRYFGPSYSALRWRWIGPGMHYIRTVGPSGGTMVMLRIGPGKRMPLHGHHGSELSQILYGAYDDARGRFEAGDVADLDADVEHQPVTASDSACICVSALDAPLRFDGWLARALQPVYRI